MNIDQSYIRALVGQTIHRNEMACGYGNALPKTCPALLLCTINSKNLLSINCEDGYQVVE